MEKLSFLWVKCSLYRHPKIVFHLDSEEKNCHSLKLLIMSNLLWVILNSNSNWEKNRSCRRNRRRSRYKKWRE